MSKIKKLCKNIGADIERLPRFEKGGTIQPDPATIKGLESLCCQPYTPEEVLRNQLTAVIMLFEQAVGSKNKYYRRAVKIIKGEKI